jgi:hypothetical protein
MVKKEKLNMDIISLTLNGAAPNKTPCISPLTSATKEVLDIL